MENGENIYIIFCNMEEESLVSELSGRTLDPHSELSKHVYAWCGVLDTFHPHERPPRLFTGSVAQSTET